MKKKIANENKKKIQATTKIWKNILEIKHKIAERRDSFW